MEIFMLAIMIAILVVGIFIVSYYSKNSLASAGFVQYPANAALKNDTPVKKEFSSLIFSPPDNNAHLKIMSGPTRGKTIVLHNPSFLVERDSPQLPVNDPHMSRHHALLKWNDGTWYVQDLGSTNGTYLNNKRLIPQRLTAIPRGAILQFGNSRIAFQTMGLAP